MEGQQSPTLSTDGYIFYYMSVNCVPIVVSGLWTQIPELMQMQHRETDRRQLRETESKIFQTGLAIYGGRRNLDHPAVLGNFSQNTSSSTYSSETLDKCIHSFSERPPMWNMQTHTNLQSTMQKESWKSKFGSSITASNFHTRLEQASSIQFKSLQRYVYWMCSERGRRLDGRLCRGRCRWSDRHHCIRSPRQKIRRKRSGNSRSWRRIIHTPLCQWFNKTSEDGPTRVDLIRIWLKMSLDVFSKKTMMDQILRQDKQTPRKRSMNFWSISGSFTYRYHVLNRENNMCFEKNHLLFHKLHDCWNVDGERPLLRDPQFQGNLHPKDTCWQEKTHKDRNHVQPWWNLAGSMVEDIQTFSTGSNTGMGHRKTKLDASRRLIRIFYIAQVWSRTKEENWKRKRNPPCRVKHRRTPTRRHWIILCQSVCQLDDLIGFNSAYCTTSKEEEGKQHHPQAGGAIAPPSDRRRREERRRAPPPKKGKEREHLRSNGERERAVSAQRRGQHRNQHWWCGKEHHQGKTGREEGTTTSSKEKRRHHHSNGRGWKTPPLPRTEGENSTGPKGREPTYRENERTRKEQPKSNNITIRGNKNHYQEWKRNTTIAENM